MEPTQINNRDLDTEWNITSNIAAQSDSCVPMLEQITMRPRFANVEYARIFFASLCAIAIREHAKKVTPPTRVTILPTEEVPSNGASLMIKYTPAFTMVAECNRAEEGVGATIAPSSQEEKGN
jgi:hypothetical protein